jgi:AcrR family transcriptional regulator
MSANSAVHAEETAASSSPSTADELLNVAERLFAERGVGNVALTQIVSAANQRNRSALHYHFGSRGGLLSAVLNRRMASINIRREALLDTLPEAPAAIEIGRAVIAPIGQVILSEPWGPDYISIVAQVIFHPTLLGDRVFEPAHISALQRSRRLIAAVLPDVPDAALSQRLLWFIDSVILAMAHWSRDTPLQRKTPESMAALVDQLVAYGLAGLAAPAPSPDFSGPTLADLFKVSL